MDEASTLVGFIGGMIVIGFVFGVIVMALINRAQRSTSRDAPKLTTYTDQETGCQYIASSAGGITPRLMRDGRHFLGDDHE